VQKTQQFFSTKVKE